MARLTVIALLLSALVISDAQAQTVRFETNVGNFDMVLNPTNDPNLQPLVDNVIAYVGLGRYHFTAINRAADGPTSSPDDDFVLQMGGFLGFPPNPDLWPQLVQPVEKLPEAIVDADGDGEVDFASRTNSRGTVSLALAGNDVNSGTSSFFINLGSNTFLDDSGFVPFADIENMATVDRIMALMQRDLSNAAGSPGNLAFIDVPITDEGKLVVVKRALVVEADDDFSFVGPIATALQLENRNNLVALSSASTLSASSASLQGESLPFSAAIAATTVPEPASWLLLVPVAAWGAARLRRRAR